MLLVRRLLQIVFGLLVLMVLFDLAKSPAAHLVDDALIIGFVVSIILLLGPWWPNADKNQSTIQIRRLLQIVLGLAVSVVLITMLKSPTADLVTDAILIALFVLIILALGPWWPSLTNARYWAWFSKINLPTDDPKIATPLFQLAMGMYSLFHAWTHTQPNQQFHRFERLIGPLSGHEGIALAWAIIGISCFVAAWRAFGRIQTTSKNVS